MYKPINYIAGIDTIEITSPTFTERDTGRELNYFTHDSARIVQRDPDKAPKYKYRVNPDKTYYDTTTYSAYRSAILYILEDSGLQDTVKTRIDFRFDTYDTDYFDLFKLNKLISLLIAEKHDISNRYQSIDLKSGELKTARIQNKYFEIECYNKALEEPESGIKCRLELRSKALYDKDSEDTKEIKELNKWLKELNEIATDKALFASLTAGTNAYLKDRYKELTSKGKLKARDYSKFIIKYEDFIFSRAQLIDLYTKLGHKSAKTAASKICKEYNIELFRLKDLQGYVNQIEQAAAQFMEKTE